MNLAPCAELEEDEHDAYGADQFDGANSEANGEHEAQSAGGAGGRMAWGRDPTDIVEIDQSNPYQVTMLTVRASMSECVCIESTAWSWQLGS